MNAPFLARDTRVTTACLSLFSLFHLNLAFSSIEEEQRGEVIARCYWPLLRLAQRHGPIGIEATGFTLEEIARRDPSWIAEARALIVAGKVELIGSGYAQVIAPLVPARVTEETLRLGNECYERLLGTRPHLALVNEQAYSGGLVGLYLDAGYRALLMDWDNPSAHHPEWPREARYRAERALGSDGRTIALLWTNTVAFQKLQRFAHGDIELDAYLDYLRGQRGPEPRALCFYAGDGEIFDFRPGRYRTEEKLSGESEWLKLEQAYAAIAHEPGFDLVAPSAASTALKRQPLRLESAACPIPVKKQRKYNLSRWAVTGRDDVAVNAACQRIYQGMIEAPDADWKELCALWSSDFRTHITDKRWAAFRARLEACEQRWSKAPPRVVTPKGEPVTARHIDIRTPGLVARLDRRRGLALSSLQFAGHKRPALGHLPHGHFDDIHVQADWYTGDCVFEGPGEHKITDLENCEARVWSEDGDTFAFARIETPKGPIEKTMRFLGNEPRVEFDVTFHWADWGRGSLRLGHFTLLPDAFDWPTLSLTTRNGGKTSETFALAGHDVDHGAPVSFLVSASHGLGMTEGWAELGDGRARLRIEIDRATAPLLGLLTHRRIGGSLFCQFVLSALELDDTRKPSPYREGPRRFRFSVNRALP
jgi:Glycosyl hydrolase family 57